MNENCIFCTHYGCCIKDPLVRSHGCPESWHFETCGIETHMTLCHILKVQKPTIVIIPVYGYQEEIA